MSRPQFVCPTQVPAEVFRAYDIRGEASDQMITPGLAWAIGRAIGSELRASGLTALYVGRDARLSGPSLCRACVEGLLACGVDVIFIGVVPTPMLYYATCIGDTRSGVMVTASHNPGHHNGFKVVIDGKTLGREEIARIYQRVVQQDFINGKGAYRQWMVADRYHQAVVSRCQVHRPLKVVVDCGSGIAGRYVPSLYRAMGCEVIPLFCEVDGRFPHHHPDPTVPENCVAMQAAVVSHQADIGVAFDGDADRLGVVDERGAIIWPDRQLMMFAEDVLSRVPGGSIVFDVKCSQDLPKVIERAGGIPVMHQTGHSLIKRKMADIAAPLAGEMSGHVFFKEGWYGFDDGIFSGARLLSLLSAQPHACSHCFARFPERASTPELKVAVAEDEKTNIISAMQQSSAFSKADCSTIDGLRVAYECGWGLIRASNTSANLTLRFEADSNDDLQWIIDQFQAALAHIDPQLRIPAHC